MKNVNKSYSHFCSKNINVHVFEITLAKKVNKFVINELIKVTTLWKTMTWAQLFKANDIVS